MFKTLLISSILSSLLLANSDIKETTIVNKPNDVLKQENIIKKEENKNIINNNNLKIVVKNDSIIIEDKDLKNKIISLIKNDFLSKNPNVSMEISQDQNLQNFDINIDSCTSCHGYDFDKQALNKSKIISKLSEDQIKEALLGYKDGTYGGAMKSLMKSQVIKYTDDELKEIAKYILKISNQKNQN